jgi:hypothetical protein
MVHAVGAGRYEERYRLTGGAVLGLAAGLLSVGLGLVWHTPVIFAALGVLLVAVTKLLAHPVTHGIAAAISDGPNARSAPLTRITTENPDK